MRDTVDEILARLDAKPEKKDTRVPRPRVKAAPVQEDDAWRSEPLLGRSTQGNVGLLGLPLPVVEDGLSAIMNLLRAPGPFPNGLRHGLTEELAAHGQHGDTLMAHLTPGEVVVPRNLQTPEVMAVLAKAARAKGICLAQYRVGAQQNQINPRTGAPAFAEIHSHVNVDGDGFDGGEDDGTGPGSDPGFPGPDPSANDPGNSGVDPGFPGVDGHVEEGPTITASPLPGPAANSGSSGLIPGEADGSTSDGEQKVAIDSFWRQLIPKSTTANVKSVLSGLTGSRFQPKDIDGIYDEVVKNISMPDAKSFGGIDPSANPMVLTPDQFGIINSQIGGLSSKYKDQATGAFQDAVSSGRVTCPKCGG